MIYNAAVLLHPNITELVTTLGYVGLLTIIFCETGLFIGCILPGDSLLFAAGVLAARGVFKISILVPALMLVAILGYMLGYWFGDRLGEWLLKRKETIFFKKKYIDQAKEFYANYGAQALILCRLMPFVRTFCPIVAGMAKMNYQRYMIYNVIGAVIWTSLLPLLGYFVGGLSPNIEKLIFPIMLGIVFVSILPGLTQYLRKR